MKITIPLPLLLALTPAPLSEREGFSIWLPFALREKGLGDEGQDGTLYSLDYAYSFSLSR